MKKNLLALALALVLSLSLMLPAFAAEPYDPVWFEVGVTMEEAPYSTVPLMAI